MSCTISPSPALFAGYGRTRHKTPSCRSFLLAASLLCALPSCAHPREREAVLQRHFQPPLRHIILESPHYPGSPLVLAIIGLDDSEEDPLRAVILQNGRELSSARFFPAQCAIDNDEILVALPGIPLEAEAGPAKVEIRGGRWPGVRRENGHEVRIEDDSLRQLPFDIALREYPNRVLKMNAQNTALVYKPDPEKTRQADELWKVISTYNPKAVHQSDAFLLPLEATRRSSGFGDKRTYEYSNGKVTHSYHLGLDFPAPTGTAVHSPGPGRIIMATDRIVSGKSIIIEHLPGLISIFYHLDSIRCSLGDLVDTEGVIATVGSTGFSTGPHLHWELRSGTVPIDPDFFLARPLIDKERIITTMDAKYGRLAEGG